jgi:hypothetical protein
MEFQKALDLINDNIREYRQMNGNFDAERLLVIMSQIIGTLHYLEGQRSLAHQTHNDRLYLYTITNGETVSKAEIMANKDVPELYLLRHFMNSAYKTTESIRSTISWLKTEKQSI